MRSSKTKRVASPADLSVMAADSQHRGSRVGAGGRGERELKADAMTTGGGVKGRPTGW